MEHCSNPEISVIMLTFNREKLLSNMIDCILNQSFKNFEFIVVDNGSTDNSGNIADDYAKMDARVRVIHRTKGSIGSGRNTGLDNAKGKYIAFVDDDDICEKDFLEFLHNLLVENNADMAICGATWSSYDDKLILSADEAIEVLLWRKRYNVAFPTKLIKSELFDNNRFLEEGKYDDIYLMPRIISEAKKIAYHGIAKYTFNRHDSNNSAWTQHHELLEVATLSEYVDVYNDRTNWLSVLFPAKEKIWRYFKFSFYISMVEKVEKYNLLECAEIKEKLVETLRDNQEEFCRCEWISDNEKKWMREYVL